MGKILQALGLAPSAKPQKESKAQRRQPALTHNVYVVELSKKVWSEDRKFREANPHYKGGQCL